MSMVYIDTHYEAGELKLEILGGPRPANRSTRHGYCSARPPCALFYTALWPSRAIGSR